MGAKKRGRHRENRPDTPKRVRTQLSQRPRYPYPVYYKYRVPVYRSPQARYLPRAYAADKMGIATVIKDYGTEILNAIRDNDLQALKGILEKHLKSSSKIAKLCVSDIKHRPTKKFACPLILAARQDDPRIIRYMMEKGTDPNFVHHTIFSSKRREDVTALHIAVDLGLYDTVAILLEANANPNLRDHNDETPLHIAVKKADRVMTVMLMSHGGSPDIVDRRGNAVLHIATLYGHLQLVRIMLKYNADVYQKGQFGAIPPHIAAKEGHIHLIQLFCSRDVGNINIKIPCYDGREKASIHLAAENGHIETVRSLLTQFDAEVNLKDSDGNTPLHCCVLNLYDPHRMRDKDEFTETARSLVKHHVSINEKNVYGDTALHLAAMNRFQRIVELLLEVGANPFVENDEGLKPIDVVPDSDPVTKNVLKMAMLNPRRPIVNLSRSMDTLERENQNIEDINRQHVKMTDGIVESSSQSTPENALDQSLSMRSVSQASSYPSVFDETTDPQGLGRVPVGSKPPKDRHNRQEKEHGEEDKSHDSDLSQSQSSQPTKHRDRTRRHKKDNMHSDIPPELPDRRHENEIPSHSVVKRDKRKKEEPISHPQGSRYDDDAISYATESSFADTNSVFSTGAGNSNALVQREIQKLFSKQQVVQKKQKRRQESLASDTASYMDESVTDPHPNESFEQSISEEQSLDHSYEQKKKRKKAKSRSKDNSLDLYTDDKVIYENIPDQDQTAESWASESVASEESSRHKKKKAKGKSKLGSVLATAQQSKQDVVPYDSHGNKIEPGSVKVNTVPGRPGTIEVQYSGGPITISVDTSAVDQLADGQYYFTDQYGQQFPVDLQNPQDLFYLQQLQQGQIDRPPARPPKGEPIYANTSELLRGQKPPMPSPNKMGQLQDTSGFANGSVSIREMDDTQESNETYEDEEQGNDSYDVEEEESINTMIKSKVKEATKTPVPASRSTPTKQIKIKPVKKPRTSKASERELPAEPMVITRAVSLQEQEDQTASPDESPNVSPQYKSFAQKLLWAKASVGEKTAKSEKKSRPPIQFDKPKDQEPREEDEEEQSEDSEDSSSHSEDESVIASPFKKSIQKDTKKPGEQQIKKDHDKMYSLTPEIDVEESSSDSESSDGESSVVHKPNAGPRPIRFRDAATTKTIETVTIKETKNDNVTKVEVLEKKESLVEQQKRKPKVRPRKTKSPEMQEPLPTSEDMQARTRAEEEKERKNREKAEKEQAKMKAEKEKVEVILAEELPQEQVWEHYEQEPGRGRKHFSPTTLEVSTTLSERSQSVDSIASDYSEGGTRRLNMRVTGEVPKAYTRAEKDPARRAFMGATPQSVESGSEASDAEFGSRNSLTDRMFGSHGNLSERTLSPASAERAKRWSEEYRPVNARTPEGLLPRNSPNQQKVVSPIPPDQKQSKAKLIGSYTQPYKSFGKITVKTDALEEAVVSSPLSSSFSPDPGIHSPGQKQNLPTFPSSEIKITESMPEIQKANIIKPQAISAQNVEVITYPTVPKENQAEFSAEEAHRLHSKKPKESTAQVGMATSAFKKNIKVLETGPETLTSELAEQQLEQTTEQARTLEIYQQPKSKPQVEETKSTFKKNIKVMETGPRTRTSELVEQELKEKTEEANIFETNQPPQSKAQVQEIKSAFKKNIKVVESGPETLTSKQAKQKQGDKRKTVSLTEERVTASGKTIKTVTTTVTQLKTAKSQSISSIYLDKSSSETETSESEDDTSSDSSESQEEYETERGQIQRQRSESMDLLTSVESSKPVFSRSISGKKPRPQLIQSQISQDDKSKSLPPFHKAQFSSTDLKNKEPIITSEQKAKDEQNRKRKEMLDRHDQMRKDAEESHKQQQQKKSALSLSQQKPVISQKPGHSTKAQGPTSQSTKGKENAKTEVMKIKAREEVNEDESPPPPPPPAVSDNATADVNEQDTKQEFPPPPLPISEPPSTRESKKSPPDIYETNLDDLENNSSSSSSAQSDVRYEQYEDEPGTRKARSVDHEQPKQKVATTAEVGSNQSRKPVPRQRSGSTPVQLETNLDDVLMSSQSVTIQQTSSESLPPQNTESQKNSGLTGKLSSGGQAAKDEDLKNSGPQPLQMASRSTEQSSDQQPKKPRIQGRRQIGKPRRGEQVIQQDDKSQVASRPVNTSFGPEDEEVAKITNAAKDRKEAIRAKKLREHEWALKQKSSEEQEKLRAEEEFEQAMLAAKAQHGKALPIGNAQVLNPIPGVEIRISGGNNPEVSGPENREPMQLPTTTAQMIPTSISTENLAEEKKKGFLKFPSKRTKKEKSTEDLTKEDEKTKKKKKTKKKSKDVMNESSASIASNIESNIYETIADVQEQGKSESGLKVLNSPQSPEGQGIEQTVMGSRVERGDTVKQRPSDLQRGAGFILPVKRERKESSDDGYDKIPFDEAAEIVPIQSGLSQTQILANMMKEKQRKGSSMSRQAAMDNNLNSEERTDSDAELLKSKGNTYPGQPQQGLQAGQKYPGQPQQGLQPGQQYPGQPQQGLQAGQQYPGQPQQGLQPGQQYPGQPQQGLQAGQQYPGQLQQGLQPGQQYQGQPQQGLQPGQLNQGHLVGQQQPSREVPYARVSNRAPPKETCIDDDLPAVAPVETNIDDDIINSTQDSAVMMKNLKNQKSFPVHQETNLDDPPEDDPVPQFSRSQVGRKSHGRKKRGAKDALPQPPVTPACSGSEPHLKSASATSLPPDPNQLSEMWSSTAQQEEDMRKVLQNIDNVYEQPVCHEEHSRHTQPHVAPSSQGRPPLPPSHPARHPGGGDWSHSRVEVVDMQPPTHHAPPPPSQQPQRAIRPIMAGSRSLSSLGTTSSLGAASDSEALHGAPQRTHRIRGRRKPRRRNDTGHHSDAEMNEFEAPPLPDSPGITLQEAALQTITAGLKDQPKLTPMRPLLPESERQINYTRGVYRPKSMEWKGSSRSSMGSLHSGRYDDSRYDDSSLVSQMWSEKFSRHATTESEGEADTDEPGHNERQYAAPRQQYPGQLYPGQQYPGQQYPEQQHPGQQYPGQQYPGQQYPGQQYPGHEGSQAPAGNVGHLPPSGPHTGQEAPVRRRPKKKRKPIPEPGPVDFSQYSPTVKLWMEHVDKKTVQKSETMFLQVMPREVKPHDDIQKAFRMSNTSMGDDDVFLPPQYVVARGRSLRRKKRSMDQHRSGASSGGSDAEDMLSPKERQMLLFFRVGNNWQDLAWVLFDSIQNDTETIRMLKDIEIKSPNNLTNQVHDLMGRWWKRRGKEATIEELRSSLDMCHIPYLMEELTDRNSTLYSESEDNLDTTALSDQDPDVSRLMHEYEVRSLNASAEGGALSDSGDPRRSFNLSADNLVRTLKEKGVTINRSKLGSRSSSLGRPGSYMDSSHDESVDYYSDAESRRSFVIVQPQLKSGDYRHETNI